MHEGPVSPEIMKQKIQALVQALAANPALFDCFKTNDQYGKPDANKTFAAQTTYLKIVANKAGVSLNDKQAKRILQQAGVTADEIMALQDKPQDPNVRIGIQIFLATTLALIKPSVSVFVLSNYAARQGAHTAFDPQLGIFKGAIEIIMGLLNMSSYFNLTNLGLNSIMAFADQHRVLSAIAVPLAMIAYVKGPDYLKQLDFSQYDEAGGDLLDMMGGIASDETYDKYRGSVATMTPEEVASAVGHGVTTTLSWLWNKVPAIRTQAPAANPPAESRITQRLA